MAGWESATIGELCDVVNGGTPKTGVAEYWGGQHRWITPAEMGKRSSPYIDRTGRSITDQGLQNSSARTLPPYSVILSSRAPIGHLVINTEPMATNQGCKGLVPRSRIEHKFLYYYLGSIVDLLNELGTGATFKELSGGNLKKVVVPLPPLAEQQRIVTILDEAFDGIAIAKVNAEKTLRNARDLFDSRVQEIFRVCGNGCRAERLTDLCEVKDGTHDSPQYVLRGIPFVTQKNIRPDGLSFESTKFISLNDHANFYRRSNVAKGDILISMIGANRGMSCLVDDDRIFSIKNVGLVKKGHRVNQEFLLAYLQSPGAAIYVSKSSKGGAQEFIGLTQLRNFPIPFPSIERQQAISAELAVLSKETGRLQSLYAIRVAALDELKASVLHKAFLGEL